MDSLCLICVKDDTLANYIKKNGNLVDECSICGTKKIIAVDQDSYELEQLIRSLVRFNIDEWDYNSHFGGDSLEVVIENNKYFFSELFYANVDAAEDFISHVVGNGYYEVDKGISLFYGEGGLLNAIKYSNSIKKRDIIYLANNKEYNKLLSSVSQTIDYCEYYISSKPQDLSLYRARIGIKEEGYPADDFEFRMSKYFLPYQNDEIGTAPIQFVNKGRMNRDGFSFLYLAEDANTAVHEVRPSPGDYVSIGNFKQVKDLKLADFTKIDILDFCKNDTELTIFEELYDLNRFLSNPIGTNQSYQYLYTQLISEELIRRNFDGIKFSSSLTGKANYAIFSTTRFKYNANEQDAFEIKKFIVEYIPLKLMEAGKNYREI